MTAAQFLEAFLCVSLQAALLVSACAILAARTRSDRVRNQIWSNCQLGLLCFVLLAAFLPHIRWLRGADVRDAVTLASQVRWQSTWGFELFVIWAGGTLVGSLLLVASAWRVGKFLKDLPRLCDILPELANALMSSGLSPKAEIFVSDEIGSPYCWQFHRPVIVLPRKYLLMAASDLELILRHELAHLDASHPLELFLQRVVEVIYWFHPAIYSAARQANISRELTCDAAAARTRQEIAAYLRATLKVIELDQQTSGSWNQWGLGWHSRDFGLMTVRARRLAERAQSMATRPQTHRRLPSAVLVLAAVISTFWLPVDVLDSSRTNWSPTPNWTASALHSFGFNARDYEIYERPRQVVDRLQDQQ